MELEELAEPDWPAQAPPDDYGELDDGPTGWAADPPARTDEVPVWVDAYEL